jgi:hypothetical protein
MRVDNAALATVAGVFILDRLGRRFRWARRLKLMLPIAAVIAAWWRGRVTTSQQVESLDAKKG